MDKAKNHKLILLWAIPLALAAVLLTVAASMPAQASLDDTQATRSEEYTADLKLANLSVALTENGNTRSYTDNKTGELYKEPLLQDLNGGNQLSFGKRYQEDLAAFNDGTQDEYVRVVINKYWWDPAMNQKATQLSPDLIELNYLTDDWIVVEDPASAEQVVLYSVRPLAPGESLSFADTLRIDPKALEGSIRSLYTNTGEESGYVTTDYTYETYNISLDVEVSAVQTHSAEDAITSAWGIDMNNVAGTGRAIQKAE